MVDGWEFISHLPLIHFFIVKMTLFDGHVWIFTFISSILTTLEIQFPRIQLHETNKSIGYKCIIHTNTLYTFCNT